MANVKRLLRLKNKVRRGRASKALKVAGNLRVPTPKIRQCALGLHRRSFSEGVRSPATYDWNVAVASVSLRRIYPKANNDGIRSIKNAAPERLCENGEVNLCDENQIPCTKGNALDLSPIGFLVSKLDLHRNQM